MYWPGTTSVYAYDELMRYNDAIEALRQAVRIDPEYVNAWNNLGAAYVELKRYNDAIEASRQAVRIDPENANAWYNLGVAYAFSGNRTEALNVVQELRRLDPVMADSFTTGLNGADATGPAPPGGWELPTGTDRRYRKSKKGPPKPTGLRGPPGAGR